MIKIKSQKEQLNNLSHQRAIVVECAVAIEQMISNQVCFLMDIDRSTSKLFGMGSSSLSSAHLGGSLVSCGARRVT